MKAHFCPQCCTPRRPVWAGLCARCIIEAVRHITRHRAHPDPRPVECRYAMCEHKRCLLKRIKVLRNRLKTIADRDQHDRAIHRAITGDTSSEIAEVVEI